MTDSAITAGPNHSQAGSYKTQSSAGKMQSQKCLISTNTVKLSCKSKKVVNQNADLGIEMCEETPR